VVRRFAGDDVSHVVVIGAAGELTRATVVDTAPLDDADAWLAGARRDADAARRALAVLTRAVAAYRIAAADPWLADPDPARAVTARIGYGSGEAVAAGEWDAAEALPAPDAAGGLRRGRRRVTSPTDRAVALLSGRDAALACEELALRARADLDRGRGREAALQLDTALRTALAELQGWRGHRDMATRLAELTTHAAPVAAAAARALAGGLHDGDAAALGTALGRLEAALRARSAEA
jgi:hypothetical protein